jgi:hypothetical protein
MNTSEKAQRNFAYKKFLEDVGAEDSFRAKKLFLEKERREKLLGHGRAHLRKGIEQLYQIMGTWFIDEVFSEEMKKFVAKVDKDYHERSRKG